MCHCCVPYGNMATRGLPRLARTRPRRAAATGVRAFQAGRNSRSACDGRMVLEAFLLLQHGKRYAAFASARITRRTRRLCGGCAPFFRLFKRDDYGMPSCWLSSISLLSVLAYSASPRQHFSSAVPALPVATRRKGRRAGLTLRLCHSPRRRRTGKDGKALREKGVFFLWFSWAAYSFLPTAVPPLYLPLHSCCLLPSLPSGCLCLSCFWALLWFTFLLFSMFCSATGLLPASPLAASFVAGYQLHTILSSSPPPRLRGILCHAASCKNTLLATAWRPLLRQEKTVRFA